MSEDRNCAAVLSFSRQLDEQLEELMLRDEEIPSLVSSVLASVADVLQVDFAACFTTDVRGEGDEQFWYPHDLSGQDRQAIVAAVRTRGSAVEKVHQGSWDLLAHPLDFHGHQLGTLVVGLRSEPWERRDEPLAIDLLDAACEQLDDVLYAAFQARSKQHTLMRLADALRHRSLAEALRRAVSALFDAIDMDKLLVVCTSDPVGRASIHLQVYERGQLRVDTMGLVPAVEQQDSLVRGAERLLHDEDHRVLELLEFRGDLEETLIDGVVEQTVVGKIVASARTGPFTRYDRDLFSMFASFVRQRVVDFHKEWRTLSASFSPDHVLRLVREDDYERRYLRPREQDVGIVYADITGFTRLSEQVLRSPDAVARLVESWGEKAVQIIWKHAGVFDKMVGDCVIALFGPPFYDTSPADRLASAIECAIELRSMTEALGESGEVQGLGRGQLTVSVGVNLARLFVGLFQPGNNFTGFSSGMNNTARLQGVARGGQILVMEEAARLLPADFPVELGPVSEARVKNVAEPLRFRPVQ